jgi:hypothetical protein
MVRRMGQDFILMEVLRDDWFAAADERSAVLSVTGNDSASQPTGHP